MFDLDKQIEAAEEHHSELYEAIQQLKDTRATLLQEDTSQMAQQREAMEGYMAVTEAFAKLRPGLEDTLPCNLN
eukprot:4501147-Amphidinium_carterae.1